MPAKTAQRLGMMPLERSTDGRRAGLAMVDPTDDITPLWPALTAAGVSEVRRFLVHLQHPALGPEAFYGVTWLPDSELIEAPSPPGRPEKSEAAIEVDPEPLSEEDEDGASLAELVAAASHSGTGLAPVKSTGPVPKIDPAAVSGPVRSNVCCACGLADAC